MEQDPVARGAAIRRRVLGEDHVARAEAAKDAFDAPFQELIAASAWGRVWAREGLTLRERSLLSLVLLAALGHWEEFAMHVRATRATGASPADVREALLHVAVYAGVPAANRALKLARAAYAEIGVDPAAEDPA